MTKWIEIRVKWIRVRILLSRFSLMYSYSRLDMYNSKYGQKVDKIAMS